MPPSNPVEDCLHAGLAGLGWCMVSWLIGVLLLVLEYARRWGVHNNNSNNSSNPDTAASSSSRHGGGGGGPPWLTFAPFWIGDALALLVLARVVSKVASVRFAAPTRNRGARRIDGRVRSSSSLNDLSGHGSGHSSSNHGGGASFIPVTLDYFPLLQRVVVTAIGVFVVLVLLTVEQVLVCCRWGRVAGDTGVPSAMAIAAPLLVLEVFCLVRVTLIRTQGWLSGTT